VTVPRVDAPESVAFVFPPFGALSFPSLGLSILKSALQQAGIGCDIRYLSFDFLDRLPGSPVERLALYDAISQRNDWCLGDWVFSEGLSGRDEGEFEAFLAAQGADANLTRACRIARPIATRLVQDTIEGSDWSRYRVVGFHSIFNQTTACLSLARALKRRYPRVVTLFGGPGAQGDLGIEIVRQFEQIDYAGTPPSCRW
jgi:magnesium-protoporphyrin IX monomethyl ester (oxidative) cyclase